MSREELRKDLEKYSKKKGECLIWEGAWNVNVGGYSPEGVHRIFNDAIPGKQLVKTCKTDRCIKHWGQRYP